MEVRFFRSAQAIATAVVSGSMQFGAASLTAGFWSLADKGGPKVIAGMLADPPRLPCRQGLRRFQRGLCGRHRPCPIPGDPGEFNAELAKCADACFAATRVVPTILKA